MKTGKRILSVLLAVLMCFAVMPVSIVMANGPKSMVIWCDNLDWSYDEATCTLTISGEGKMPGFYDGAAHPWGSSVIKNLVIEEGVTNISSGAFWYTEIENVELADSVESIGYYAFAGCDKLKTFPLNKVKSIGQGAFAGCQNLETIEISEYIESIFPDAFSYCNIKSISVSENNKMYSSDDHGCLFNKDKTVLIKYPVADESTAYKIPDSVTKIEDHAFENGDYLTEIDIPENITSVGARAFYDCGNLEKVTFSGSLDTIGSNAFYNCDKLTEVTLPVNLTTISDYSFSSCDNLKNVNFSNKVTTIGNCAFAECPSLEIQEIPASVTTIGGGAYSGCSIENLIIPENVTSIGAGAFFNCASLKTVEILGEISIIEASTFSYCTELTEVIIPDGIKSIGDGAFSGCNKITTLKIPNSVTDIGDYAFSDCELLNVYIPSSVITIGTSAFEYCDSVTDLVVPSGVKSIGDYAFAHCENLKSITIPRTVETIGSAIAMGCYNLDKIIVDDNSAYYSDDDNGVLYDKNKTIVLQYPAGKSDSFYEVPYGVKTIGTAAFCSCDNLSKIKLPATLETIEGSAFGYCDLLTEIEIPENVRSIGNDAFRCCQKLEKINIPESVEKIGYNAFSSCEKLADIIIGDNAIYIEDGAFYHTKWYENQNDGIVYIGKNAYGYKGEFTDDQVIEVAEGTKSIAKYAFNLYDDSQIEKIYIPSSVELICDWSIKGFKVIEVSENNLYFSSDEYGVLYNKEKTELILYPGRNTITDFTVPSTVKTISDYAFDDLCWYLQKIILPASIENVGYGAFGGIAYVSDAYYCGSEEEWNSIVFEEGNSSLTIFTNIHFNYNGNHVHVPQFITNAATCTSKGFTYEICEECKEVISEAKEIPMLAHTLGEWETALEPTYEAEGKKVKKCTICSEILEEENIPRLNKVVAKDKKTDVSIEVNGDDYDGSVDVIVEESFDGTAFNIVDTQTNSVNTVIYDIKMTVDGVVVQPNGKVIVKIPLPEGYKPESSFVYHVNTETGKVERMNAVYEDGYLVFETDHFSYYAVADEHNHSYDSDDENCQICGFDRTDDCSCNCHKSGIANFFFKIILFFQRIFGTNKNCSCGVAHY